MERVNDTIQFMKEELEAKFNTFELKTQKRLKWIEKHELTEKDLFGPECTETDRKYPTMKQFLL